MLGVFSVFLTDTAGMTNGKAKRVLTEVFELIDRRFAVCLSES
jgi:hypothetical protein